MAVICDWLDLSYSPDENLPEGLTDALNESLFSVSFVADERGGTRTLWRSENNGTVTVQSNPNWSRVSASGLALDHLRGIGRSESYYASLSTEPYRVTRIDLALDLDVDAPVMIADYRKRYSMSCNLTRKAVKTRFLTETRADGLETGTFYVGKQRSGAVTARVYDKQLEVLSRTGVSIPPRTRVEVTARSATNATLRDAALPDALFWHLASPALLDAPAKLEPWTPADPSDTGWTKEMREFVPYQVLKNRVNNTPDLSALVELSRKLGPDGLQILEGMISKRLTAEYAVEPAVDAPEQERASAG